MRELPFLNSHSAFNSPSPPGLHLLTQIHDMVPANGTVINHNVPGPESYRIPLQGERRTHFLLNLQYLIEDSLPLLPCCTILAIPAFQNTVGEISLKTHNHHALEQSCLGVMRYSLTHPRKQKIHAKWESRRIVFFIQ